MGCADSRPLLCLLVLHWYHLEHPVDRQASAEQDRRRLFGARSDAGGCGALHDGGSYPATNHGADHRATPDDGRAHGHTGRADDLIRWFAESPCLLRISGVASLPLLHRRMSSSPSAAPAFTRLEKIPLAKEP